MHRLALLLLLLGVALPLTTAAAQEADSLPPSSCGGGAAPVASLRKGCINTLGKEPWPVVDPFLFCAYHLDAYPAAAAGTVGPPKAALRGRNMGSDFSRQDGWSMYHGESVPGFPSHPHRGFETVTVVLSGLVDHFDSMGATGRYGNGDVQWLTTGDGVQHSEMFPLLNETGANPLELFQLWLNQPRKTKRAKPFFSMFWREELPVLRAPAPSRASVLVIAGELSGVKPLQPPPASWASQPGSDVAIWLVTLRGADDSVDLPAAKSQSTRRVVYYVRGDAKVYLTAVGGGESCSGDGGEPLVLATPWRSVEVDSQRPMRVRATHPNPAAAANAAPRPTLLLVLQGAPIGEPVAQHGPFVMNTQQEIQQTFADYRATGFGGWPWPTSDHHHDRGQQRFCRRALGGADEYPPPA